MAVLSSVACEVGLLYRMNLPPIQKIELRIREHDYFYDAQPTSYTLSARYAGLPSTNHNSTYNYKDEEQSSHSNDPKKENLEIPSTISTSEPSKAVAGFIPIFISVTVSFVVAVSTACKAPAISPWASSLPVLEPFPTLTCE